MAKGQLRGKYVPDKDGKLRTVLKLTEIKANVPVSDSCYHDSSNLFNSPAWYNRIWFWVKNRIL